MLHILYIVTALLRFGNPYSMFGEIFTFASLFFIFGSQRVVREEGGRERPPQELDQLNTSCPQSGLIRHSRNALTPRRKKYIDGYEGRGRRQCQGSAVLGFASGLVCRNADERTPNDTSFM